MPMLRVISNQALGADVRPEVLKQLSETVATALGKPERYVMVSYSHNPDMLFGGSNAPLAYLELKSIGLPGDGTSELSRRITAKLGQLLDIPADRIYIEFANAERHMWGWDGGTFA